MIFSTEKRLWRIFSLFSSSSPHHPPRAPAARHPVAEDSSLASAQDAELFVVSNIESIATPSPRTGSLPLSSSTGSFEQEVRAAGQMGGTYIPRPFLRRKDRATI